MLARRAERPFNAAGWLFELKYDGFRVLAVLEGGRPSLWYRGGEEAGAGSPEIVEALRGLPAKEAVVDGELVVLDGDGRPVFQRLQRRFQLPAGDAPREPPAAGPLRVEEPPCQGAPPLGS